MAEFFQIYLDVCQPQTQQHQERVRNLMPHLPNIWIGAYPRLPEPHLRKILLDLKAEGNEMFNSTYYDLSYQFYNLALEMARNMHDNGIAPNPELISTLLSNKAACSLKMGLFDNALVDSDVALSVNPTNVKASYRKSMALKGMNQTDAALGAAQEGLLMARLPGDIKSFRELITELQEIICKPTMPPKPKPAPVYTYPGASAGAATPAGASAQNGINSEKKTSTTKAPNGVDNEWLEATNVHVTRKAAEQREKIVAAQMKKAKKRYTAPPPAKPLTPQRDVSEDESNSDNGDEMDLETAKALQNKANGKLNGTKPSSPAPRKAPTPPGPSVINMGLDHFGGPKAGSPVRRGSSPMRRGNSPLRRGPHPTVKAASPVRVPAQDKFTSRPGGSRPPLLPTPMPPPPIPPPPDIEPSFLVVGPRPMPPPTDQYEFQLVCSNCFHNVRDNRRYADHKCDRQQMLIRRRFQAGAEWMKIRPRRNTQFYGTYKPCRSMLTGARCREQCTFSHSMEEIEFWNMDRSGMINIRFFMNGQKSAFDQEEEVFITRQVDEAQKQYYEEVKRIETQQLNYRRQQQRYLEQQAELRQREADRFEAGKAKANASAAKGGNEVDANVFPLDDYKWYIACEGCIQETPVRGYHCVISTAQHKCSENILLVAVKSNKSTSAWIRIRERKGHRNFRGSYQICRNFLGSPPQPCTVGQLNCSFAHSLEEQQLWTLEKDGKFGLQQFISAHKRTSQGFQVQDFYTKHRGHLRFICRECFNNSRIMFQKPDVPQECGYGHQWTQVAMLAHRSPSNSVSPIQTRPFQHLHKKAFYNMCHNERYCRRAKSDNCNFAHSMVERDFWLLERDTDRMRDDLQQEFARLSQEDQGATTSRPATTSAPGSAQTATVTPAATTAPSVAPAAAPAMPRPNVRCPHRILDVCRACWSTGARSEKDPNKNVCSNKSQAHQWSHNVMYLVVPANKVLRNLPHTIPRSGNFVLCTHVAERRPCHRETACQFAHSEIEMQVWKWMVDNKVGTPEEACQLSKASHGQSMTAPQKIPVGKPVVSAWSLPAGVENSAVPIGTPEQSARYCQYCSVHCNSERQWREHTASEKHRFNVNSDKEHQWNFRQPPWGLGQTAYRLCESHKNGICRYSHVSEMYNQCPHAHSQDELDEWKERAEWREMKRSLARTEHVCSYMDELLEEYNTAALPANVLLEDVPEVEVQCSSDLEVYEEQKKMLHVWKFKVSHKAGLPLQTVALLHDYDRIHFSLQGQGLPERTQLAEGEQLRLPGSTTVPLYSVSVQFQGDLFGSFTQWVAFDFGTKPITIRKLNVEVGVSFVQDNVKKLREKLNFDLWTSENRNIIFFNQEEMESYQKSFMGRLHSKYRVPTAADVANQRSLGVELNRHNYVHKMHDLLYLEELTQSQIISSFDVKTYVQILDRIQEGAIISPRPGELFACVPLGENLNDDTDAGKLILKSCLKVLLTPMEGDGRNVYEAYIINRDTFGVNFEGKFRDKIYLVLSPRCVADLAVRPGEQVEMELQFQMNREPLCAMHYALDMLNDTQHVFPDISQIRPRSQERHPFTISTSLLNEDQMKIVKHVLAERVAFTPPLIVHGPFGTGKTETLAQAVMLLMKAKPSAKILICTQSNSAADLYIEKHLDAFISEQKKTMIRIHYLERRSNTVNKTVRSYCLMDDYKRFRMPQLHELKQVDVVVTTTHTSVHLTRYGIRGHFTHIFIDEAGQALECTTIIPFTLADERTVMVLAGDHIQMSPKVYSEAARVQRFHRSLLERLFHHYQSYEASLRDASPLTIMLSQNYRTQQQILQFIAQVYYGGPENLQCLSDQRDVPEQIPLTFYVAQGHEVLEPDSTSYYNQAEVQEVVTRVQEVYDNWPQQWGERNAEAILVVSPYYAQVTHLRGCLRQANLRGVNVHRMDNVQGLEFRVLFISTVRTRHLADMAYRVGNENCDGGDYGFLSDMKLLNTALTRTQSRVCVVGDPVALCSIGECMNIWRSYLGHCQQLDGVFPSEITLETIRQQVQALMNTGFGNRLQHLAEQHKRAKQGLLVEDTEARRQEAKPDDLRKISTFDSLSRGGFFEDWSLDYMIEPDRIIQLLGQEVVRTRETTVAAHPSQKVDVSHLRVKCVRIQDPAGEDAVQVVPVVRNEESSPRRRLLSAHHADQEFDEDEQSDFSDESVERNVHCEFSDQQLQEFLTQQPDKYKRCILKIEGGNRMFAKTMDKNEATQEIVIASRQRCGRAFNDDEVVVELVESDEADLRATKDPDALQTQGQVVGILRRAINPRYRMFVCMVDPANTNIMIPLNRGVPRMYNLQQEGRHKKGHVAVYTFTQDNEIHFHHYEPLDPNDPEAKLYIVRYLKWDPKFYSPLCVVVGVKPAGRSHEEGMAILDIEHYIKRDFKDDIMNEVSRLYHRNYEIPKSAHDGRVDFRDTLVFTVDPPESRDLDDALSITQHADGKFCIGIHIADVSHYVKQDSAVDKEAFKRGTSYYPEGGPAVPMIPERLATDLCSLLPGKDRLTISLFIYVDHKGIITSVKPRRAVIRSRHRLTYEDAESYLTSKAHTEDQELFFAVLRLEQMANYWRQQRLGPSGSMMSSVDAEVAQSPRAHSMIEELMIQANSLVAGLLLEHYGDCVPLRTQPAPNNFDLDQWREEYGRNAGLSPVLTAAYLPSGQRCSCRDVCTCAPTLQEPVKVSNELWSQVIKAVTENDTTQLRQLLLNPMLHPAQSVATLALYMLQERSLYACGATGHHSLQLPVYTHFTSPIRRYLDVVVHRLLVASLEHKACPYTQPELSDICEHCTNIAMKARHYERATLTLALSDSLTHRPLVLYPVVDQVDDAVVAMRFPAVKEISPSTGNLVLNTLQPSEKPELIGDNVQLMWRLRLYDLLASREEVFNHSGTVALPSESHSIQIEPGMWRLMLAALRQDEPQQLLKLCVSANETCLRSPALRNMSSEVASGEIRDHYTNFRLSLSPCTLLRLQVSTQMRKGLLMPCLQLFSITPRLDFCLEHRDGPIKCYANPVNRMASKQNYADLKEYKTLWTPVIALEAAHAATQSGEGAFIHNVPIKWEKRDDKVFGSSGFSSTFLEDRQLNIEIGDLLCVRFHNLQLTTSSGASHHALGEPVTWVGHCIIYFKEEVPSEYKVTFYLRLHQSSVPFPEVLLENTGCRATVEYLPKPLPHRMMEKAVRCLGEASDLVRSIALNRAPQPFSAEKLERMRRLQNVQVPQMKPPNPAQASAINSALTNPYTLIQGPPGTGKTVTGVRLAYLLIQANRSASHEENKDNVRPQLMYCGPSNKSVDVVAGYLKHFQGARPNMVRVYSDRIERLEFPLPQDTLGIPGKKNKDHGMPLEHKDISLHHLIRSPDTTYGRLICEYDQMFRDPAKHDTISREIITDYLRMINSAKGEVLKRAEAILCTCTVAASPKMSKNCNVVQVIVDECSMAMEPEAMIPLTLLQPQQVILIGDHRQLRPVVTESMASRFGLETSLFERHCNRAVMLTTQYRMHEFIAQFPSDEFYNSLLQCGQPEQTKPSSLKFWPGGRDRPVAMVHLMGREEMLTVATSDGSMRSASNADEVKFVVHAVKQLKWRYHVTSSERIAVLSQYRAQCAAISRDLKALGPDFSKITVASVVESQGSEWDYVVLSTVRSLPRCEIEMNPTRGWRNRNLGLITDCHQVNVAITRARKGLIIVGNRYLLGCDPVWKRLIAHLEKNKAIIEAKQFMPTRGST